ncbi:chemotaxis protein CheY [Natronomonas halophila]|uniref:RAD55 family ATPase n=1 Tax=Natronomonas halophila TaxID=2747817 RepID=UPI0015B63970|nr:chemotaxis protein CheY [Natronomonas halophila]QLD85047.1 chemotaxis protein CheY [Natronomonas halophila]
MVPGSASAARDLSDSIDYIPFGIRGLDGDVRGIPTGSCVLLAGAPDAGGDAFTYTSLARLMAAKHRPETVRSELADRAEHVPESVTYLTLSNDREHVYSELDAVLDDESFDVLADHMTVADYSQRFMDLLPVPSALFEARRKTPNDSEEASPLEAAEGVDEPADPDPDVETFGDLLEDIGDRLAEASDNLIVVDSLSDLERATEFGLPRNHKLAFLIGLREAVVNWGTVAFVKYDSRAAEVRQNDTIHGLLHGHIYFYSNDEGYTTYRTVRVGSFGGALDMKRQTVFDSIIDEHGFRAKATKKIGRKHW